ncbi:hypothetical protein AN191_14110 [Loktanella sp. 5RATIMAR09]|nr:hypothetical protein AN191_14110 [Loktanella sp. 5RATIMAR09]
MSAPVIAAALGETRTAQVRFAAGSSGTSITDTIAGRELVLYTIGAEAGQRMAITLIPSNQATYFKLYAPGTGPGDEALAVSQTTPALNAFDGTLPLSGEYTVAISMMHGGARQDERSDYTLTISISGDTDAIVQGDYADGLQGGPDFYQVVTAGGRLNLRAAPSTGADRLARLSNGQNLQNLGCRMAEGRRWCKVTTLADPGIAGWAAGDFLIEGSGAETAPSRP